MKVGLSTNVEQASGEVDGLTDDVVRVAREYAGLAALLVAEIHDRSRFWHPWRVWDR